MDRSGCGRQHGGFVQIHFERRSIASPRAARASGVHQNPPHHLGRDGEELRARVPFDVGHVHQAEVDLMDQCGRLQCIALGFVFHVAAGHPAQFRIDVLREAGQGGFVAAAPSYQEIRDFRRVWVDRSPAPAKASTNIRKRGLFWGALPPVPADGEQSLTMISSRKQETQMKRLTIVALMVNLAIAGAYAQQHPSEDGVFGNGRGQPDRSKAAQHKYRPKRMSPGTAPSACLPSEMSAPPPFLRNPPAPARASFSRGWRARAYFASRMGV